MRPVAPDQSALFRVVMIGDSSVGKTSLINKLVYDKFNQQEPSTVGAMFVLHTEALEKERVEMQIWDTAGQEKFRSLGPIYYRNADAAVVVFDFTQKSSFHNLDSWIDSFTDVVGTEAIIIVAGNKSDLPPDPEVSEESAKAWAEQNNFHFFSTSAMTGKGIHEVFHVIGEELLKRKKKNDDIFQVSYQQNQPQERVGSECSC
ncbi:small GTP-binding protein [Tritrichomonas foetus]|uniref:Small GTP-binding protein n=1 Tax=Tritrichomonas foetus TaxID=1144522 RepID=A0A1J4KAH5_9EUKA|nr:small GTP-binding protein [Tritrichomonas foetus]|eukprot:OHT08441.1 small GTP-binding protein [Tritrichomonas foetus]